jgi:hypothetical protein
MDLIELLRELSLLSISLERHGENKLRCQFPAGTLSDRLRAAILAHKSVLLKIVPSDLDGYSWDQAGADHLLNMLIEHESTLHDVIAPGCDVDSEAWTIIDAQVDAAYSARNMTGLRGAIREHEAFARAEFERWRTDHTSPQIGLPQ